MSDVTIHQAGWVFRGQKYCYFISPGFKSLPLKDVELITESQFIDVILAMFPGKVVWPGGWVDTNILPLAQVVWLLRQKGESVESAIANYKFPSRKLDYLVPSLDPTNRFRFHQAGDDAAATLWVLSFMKALFKKPQHGGLQALYDASMAETIEEVSAQVPLNSTAK
ncbi:hypothetical protein HDU78_000137 [Chytriomyces hyalinus]|nr:hypothetical protein HDU78_000137 [Chytriomyces hyalinus]